jgi:23S rRNA (adenine2503-C2)-methyltransferase
MQDNKAADAKPTPIHDLSFEELAAWCRESGLPAFRARQIWEWLYVKQAAAWDDMRNLPAPLRAQLAERFVHDPAHQVATAGRTGETRKLLLELADGERIESVLIPSGRREQYTLCVSSQVGCRFRCAFCASGSTGLNRNLSTGEIIAQALAAARLEGTRPSNLVYMGIGEPLDNYDAVLKSIRTLNDQHGLGIGARHITISTCGLVPGIRRLSGEGLQVELSVSLHAPNDELRSRLMPVNRRFPISELVPVCAEYVKRTGRIVTFEYTMIRDVNDSDAQAAQLARLLGGFGSRLNLIPLSAVEEFAGQPGTPARIKAFATILNKAGINTTVRASKGSSLSAACGQLRARHAEKGHS